MKRDFYKIDNSVEKVLHGKNTLFLDGKEFKEVTRKLTKNSYNIYYPYVDSEKVILYTNTIPEVSLFHIISYGPLRHQDILGSIMALNISSSYIGDIIIDQNNYYFYVLNELKEFIRDNLISIGREIIKLEELDLNVMENYQRKYETNEVIVSSLRIDNVLSKIIGTNRDKVLEIIKDKEVILNYDILTKNSYILKENDIFSIRKIGKFKFSKIINNTKKGNYVIEYLKYI